MEPLSEPISDDEDEPHQGPPSSILGSAGRAEMVGDQKFLDSFITDKGKKVITSEMRLY